MKTAQTTTDFKIADTIIKHGDDVLYTITALHDSYATAKDHNDNKQYIPYTAMRATTTEERIKLRRYPKGTTHFEFDGVPWKCDERNQWWYWQINFGWCRYIGAVNQNFLSVRYPVSVET
ncbi:MAG: hypothetical protein QM666_00870 [Acinetobacter sp.]